MFALIDNSVYFTLRNFIINNSEIAYTGIFIVLKIKHVEKVKKNHFIIKTEITFFTSM